MVSNDSQVAHLPQMLFFGRVVNIPVVASALQYAADHYERMKENKLVGPTMARAVQSIYYVAESAKPVVLKLEKPINFTDSIACQGLSKLEEKVPVIKKSTEEIYNEGWNKYEELKKFGTEKVGFFVSFGYNKVTDALDAPYVKAVLRSVDSAIVVTENAVDRYLPGTDDEPQVTGSKDDNVVQRMGHLSEKMRHRMYRQMSIAADLMQKTVTNNFPIISTLPWIGSKPVDS